jgi:SAM-dependent methyltransferase
MVYQSFADRPGSSPSLEKWKALGITNFSGRDVLDLGCNEGFFIAKVLEHGARSAIGVDLDAATLEGARVRVPDGSFVHEHWSDYIAKQPASSFDIVMLLSAMHYAPQAIYLLREIRRVLRHDGMLVLEASVAPGAEAFMTGVTRGRPPFTDTVYHPTGRKLDQLLFKEFSVRYVGESVMQPGDPMPRHIYHAFPRMPVAVLIRGRPGVGKSDLARLLEPAAPTYSMDLYALHVLDNDQTALHEVVKDAYQPGRIDYIYEAVQKTGNADAFVRGFAMGFLFENIFVIEGAGLLLESIAASLKSVLETARVRVVDINMTNESYTDLSEQFKL